MPDMAQVAIRLAVSIGTMARDVRSRISHMPEAKRRQAIMDIWPDFIPNCLAVAEALASCSDFDIGLRSSSARMIARLAAEKAGGGDGKTLCLCAEMIELARLTEPYAARLPSSTTASRNFRCLSGTESGVLNPSDAHLAARRSKPASLSIEAADT